MVRISIITATLNSERTLRHTLDSILRQTYRNYELIIKDCASQDETLSICKEYEPRFEGRMRIIAVPDCGLYDAMNQGIAAATGDVVGMLNSDDFYTAPDILMTIARTFEAHPEIDAVYGDVHYVEEENPARIVRYYSSRLFRRYWMRMGFMPAHPSFYCRKMTYERFRINGREIEGFKGNPDCAYFNTSYRIAADFENLLRMIFLGRIAIRYIRRDFVTMRTGGASSSGAASHRQINRDHMRAFRENGVYSNHFLISFRYCYKILEFAVVRYRRLLKLLPYKKYVKMQENIG